MSTLRIRAAVHRARRRTAVIAVLFVVAGAVVAHHAMPMGMHMGAAPTCLAVLGLAVAAATVALGALRVGRPALIIPLPAASLTGSTLRSIPARAGPTRYRVLRL